MDQQTHQTTGRNIAGPRADILSGAMMCLLSMACIQFGSALSAQSISIYGPAGVAWLRLVFAAIILLCIIRPALHRYNRGQWTGALLLGTATALGTICFFSAIERIPLGLAVAVDFLGPLSVAALSYKLSWRLIWPLIAGGGVLFLSYDGHGWIGNTAGVLFALGSACCWAVYILLTKKVGAAFRGLEGLAMSFAVSAIVAAPFGLAGAASGFSWQDLAELAGLAVLVPLFPHALEMLALRRMPAASFSILMSLEPAMGALAGFFVLSQQLTLLQIFGTTLVVAASVGATLGR